jgi:hypothetical protein
MRAAFCSSSVQQSAHAVSLPLYTDGTSRINALLAASANVAIPAGTYLITGELKVRNAQVVQPAADAQVILKTASGYAGRIINTYDKSYTLRGLTFDGAYSERRALEGAADAMLLQIIGGTSVTLEDNEFHNAPSYAVWGWRSSAIQLRGNIFRECWQPIRIDAAHLASGIIENNVFTNSAAYKSIQHIEAMNTTNLVIRGNTMRGAGMAEPTSHGYEGTWGNSIFLTNATGYLVESNKIYVNHWSAMVSGAGAAGGVIRNNYLSEGAVCSTALWIEQPGAAHILVEANQLEGGISCGDSGGDHLTIRNNTIRSRSVGIDVNSGAKTVLIQGNTIASKSDHRVNNGIYLWQKSSPDVDVRISGNKIDGFDKGIAINNPGGVGTVYGIHLSGNSFSNNNVKVWVPQQIKIDRRLGPLSQ